MGKGSRKGRDQQKGKGSYEEPLVRTAEMDARYRASPASTATNATHFAFCFSLFVREVAQPIQEELCELDCFIKFSKYISWLFRHGTDLLHQNSLSLTLHVMFGLPQFLKHNQNCTTYISSDPHHIFGNSGSTEVFEECKRNKMNVDSLRYFIPFLTVAWYNTKGRLRISILNADVVREPVATDWITTDMTVDDILAKLGNCK